MLPLSISETICQVKPVRVKNFISNGLNYRPDIKYIVENVKIRLKKPLSLRFLRLSGYSVAFHPAKHSCYHRYERSKMVGVYFKIQGLPRYGLAFAETSTCFLGFSLRSTTAKKACGSDGGSGPG